MKKLLLITFVALSSCKKEQNPVEAYYQQVQIGDDVWMSLNWDAITYRNGDPIPEITDSLEWVTATYGAWKYYDNDPLTGQRYGKLYNWYAVNDPRKLSPEGWHVATDDEWVDMLINNGLILGGFTNMSGGYVGYSTHGLGQYGMWWTANQSNETMASGYQVVNNTLDAYQGYFCKLNGFSVRHVKD